jgi:[acyl-carrier-protein] S-malonyltransferase
MTMEIWAEADPLLDSDFASLIAAEDETLLSRPVYSQLSLFALSVALFRILKQRGYAPYIVMGHSMGEVTALFAAGAISLDVAFRFLRRRAELMEEIVPPGTGAMAAIQNLDIHQVRGLCSEASRPGEIVQVAAINADNQVVIAGIQEAVRRVASTVPRIGGEAVPLKMALPVHCDLMKRVSDILREEYGRGWVSDPEIPFVSSVSGGVETKGAEIEKLLHAQLHSPILWKQSVLTAVELGIEKVIEVGLAGSLLGLIKRIDRRIGRTSVEQLLS